MFGRLVLLAVEKVMDCAPCKRTDHPFLFPLLFDVVLDEVDQIEWVIV